LRLLMGLFFFIYGWQALHAHDNLSIPTKNMFPALLLKKKMFSDKPVTFNFQNISVRAALQLLADFSGMNMIVSDKVEGNMTLRLNEVPWDRALNLILTTQGLDKRQVGHVLLIDKASIWQARENEALKEAALLKKLAPVRSVLLQLKYAKASEMALMLKDKNSSILSEKGNVSVDVRTNTIWLQDTADKIFEIGKLVRKLDIPVRQVSIEARIVNMSKDCAEDLGVRWGVSKSPHLSGTLERVNPITEGGLSSEAPVARRLNLDLGAIPLDATPASVGVALAKLGNGVLLDLEHFYFQVSSQRRPLWPKQDYVFESTHQ